MLTFFLIPDIGRFLTLADKCFGEVMLHMPDGSKQNLKRDCDAYQMLETAKTSRAGVKISLFDYRDIKPFIQYMAEAAL